VHVDYTERGGPQRVRDLLVPRVIDYAENFRIDGSAPQ